MNRHPRRITLAGAGVAVLAAGLLVHTVGQGPWVGPAGTALYAVLIYLLVAFVVPRSRTLVVAATSMIICAAVELAQLTPGPAALGDLWPPIRLIFGSTFDALDLLGYLAGVLIAMGVDAAITNRLRLRRRHPRRHSHRRSRSLHSNPR